MGPMSYEGPENYIFVSYAHKDSPQVMRVLEQLVERRYRIWYDDGLAPGSEWPEDIAQHLDKCAVFIAFISNNSMASANCRREINFALSRQKPFLGIILEPTKMTLGMEMQLSSQHCLVMDNYRNETEFLHKLFLNDDLDCCLMADGEVLDLDIPEVTQPVVAEKKKDEPVAQKKIPVVTPEPPEPARKPFWKRLLLGLFVMTLLAGAVGAGLLLGSYVTILPDLRVSRYTTTLTLKEQQVTADAIKKISALEELNSLYIEGCTLDEGALEGLNSPTLRSVQVKNTPVSSLQFLNGCPNVYNLRLDNCGITNKMFEGVDTGKIDYWDLSRNPKFSNLKVITSENLRQVRADETAVSDVSHLANFPKLTEVNFSHTNVSKIDALASLENLTVMRFIQCPISKVTTPFMSLSVHTIDFGGCGLKSLSGFENFTILRQVYLGSNQLKNVSWLEKSVNTLTDLDLSRNPLTKDSIWFLKEAVKLGYLSVSEIALGNTELFEKMTEMTVLRANKCGISDVIHLAGLLNLRELYLSENKLKDLTGLPPFTYVGQSTLDLAYNKIESVAPIAGDRFGILTLQGNPVQAEAQDFADIGGSLLTLDYHESMLNCEKMKFSRVYVKGCPADKQLALEKAVGYGLGCVTETVMLDALAQKNIHYER